MKTIRNSFNLKRVVILAFVAGGMSCRDDPESSWAKSENSAMQAMVARHESDMINELKFYSEMDHYFVCIPNNGRRVWVMLDPKYTPFYKQLPWDQNFSLSLADLKRVEETGNATLTAIHCLASHVSDSAH